MPMGCPEGVIHLPWIFYTMRSLVPVGHSWNIARHLFTSLVCGSFQWCHGLLFTDCIMWDDKDKVTGFKRSHWIHLGWWSTGSLKLQLFQLSQHSHVTNCRLIFYILSRGHNVFRRKKFFFSFWRFVCRSDAGSSFRDFVVKTTEEG